MRAVLVILSAVMAVLAHMPAHGATSAITLRDDVLALSSRLLAPANLHVDAARAQVVPSRELEPGERFTVVPLWTVVAGSPPRLPLTFELVPDRASSQPRPRVTLVTTLARDVLVPTRRLARGSVVVCSDVAPQRKPLQLVPPGALSPPCAVDGDAVLLRALAEGDVLRSDDFGTPPDVAAQGAVNVRVVQGAIVLDHAGTALADARLGDRVPVRLAGSHRHVLGRVLMPGVVMVEGVR